MDFSRRGFLLATAATAAGLAAQSGEQAQTDLFSDGSVFSSESGIKVRFLGSGAAGWKKEYAKNPHARRQSSLLVENKVLLDFTDCSFDFLPKDCHPYALFQTHSHGDHYNPTAAVKSGVKRMYVQESWASAARKEVNAAAAKLGLPAPEVIGLPFGKPVTVCGLRITGVPANHCTGRMTDGVLERTSLYLVEKGSSRLLYATDTGGIPGEASWLVGIDAHISEAGYAKSFVNNPMVHKPQALTALIMEATNGDGDEDFRIFVHSSAQLVARTVNVLLKTKRLVPPATGHHVYLTHLGIKYRNWPVEKINAELPPTLRAAKDGLEVTMG